MSSPNQDVNLGGIEVTLSSLLYQAKVWSDQANALGDISSQAEKSRYLNNPGVFGDAIGPYNTACDSIGKLCHEGQSEMTKISEALKISHDVYQETEQQITSQIMRLGM